MSSPSRDEDERLRSEGARVEALIDELSAMVGPHVRARLHELVARLVELYGAGLSRVLAHARAAAAAEADLDSRLVGDELVSSLLLLYDLHPRSTSERIEAALERVRPYLGSHAGDVRLVGVADGVARLRLLGSCDGCPSSAATVEHTVERALLDAAPEVTRVEIEGMARPVAPALTRLGARAPALRVRLEGLRVPSGVVRTCESEGARVAVIGVADEVLAYRDRCGACSASLARARMVEGVLECAACFRRFDVARGGRGVDGAAPHLVPVPVLVDPDGVRVAIVEREP